FNDFYDPQVKRDNIAAVSKDTAIHHVDLRDSAAARNVFHREKFETIVHLAARAGVRPSIQYPQLYYDTNVSGTLHLLAAARPTDRSIRRWHDAARLHLHRRCDSRHDGGAGLRRVAFRHLQSRRERDYSAQGLDRCN